MNQELLLLFPYINAVLFLHCYLIYSFKIPLIFFQFNGKQAHQTVLANLTRISLPHGSHAALPVACDAFNARTTAVKEYHYTAIWIVAAELLSLLWNADNSRSFCPFFRSIVVQLSRQKFKHFIFYNEPISVAELGRCPR